MSYRMTLAGAAILLTSHATAIEVDPDEPMICGLFEVHQCLPNAGCESVLPHEVNIKTRFLTVDFAAKEIRATKTERRTIADQAIDTGATLVLSGAVEHSDFAESGIGYSMTIAKQTGRMTMSAAAEDVAFTIFGSCTQTD